MALANVRSWIVTPSSVVSLHLFHRYVTLIFSIRPHFYMCQIYCTEWHMLQSQHDSNASAQSSHGQPDQEGWLGGLCYHQHPRNLEPCARPRATTGYNRTTWHSAISVHRIHLVYVDVSCVSSDLNSQSIGSEISHQLQPSQSRSKGVKSKASCHQWLYFEIEITVYIKVKNI